MTVERNAPSMRTWLLAAMELIGALVLVRVTVESDSSAMQHGEHSMPMAGAAGTPGPHVHWTWPVYAASASAAIAAIWWQVRRQAVAAAICAVAVTTCAVSQPIRVLATQSHFVAMLVLEVLLVLVPLLVVTLSRRPSSTRSSISRGWTSLTVGSAIGYSALLVVLHVPSVHQRGMELGAVPLWITLVAPLLGVAYWFGVLCTTAVVPLRTRRAALLGAQEVAAFVGLLNLFGVWGPTAHHSPLGFPAAWDQRLGGVVMMVTCAAVAIPIARRLR